MKLGFPNGTQLDIDDSYAFDASWQGNGNLKVGIGNFETGSAGESYFANMTIRRHPADLDAIDITRAGGRRISQALNDEQTGTVAKNIGTVYLPAGTLKVTSRALMGTTTAAPDEATLELKRESDALSIATWTRQGTLGDTVLSAEQAIPTPGWYYFELSGSAVGVVAQVKGIELEVV